MYFRTLLLLLAAEAVAAAMPVAGAQATALAPGAQASGTLTFVHIPKNAGTKIENVGLAHGFYWGRFVPPPTWHPDLWAKHGWAYPHLPCSPWHVPPASYQVTLSVNPYDVGDVGDKTFCVVRDPFSRAISEVLYEADSAQSCGHNNSDCCASDTINERVNQKLDRVEALLNNTASWNGRLGIGDWAKITTYDCHWLPQVAYTNGPGVPACDHVLHVETLAEDWAKLMRELPKNLRINASEFETTANTSPCQDVTVGVLDNRSRERLSRLYAADFQEFNYRTAMLTDYTKLQRSSLDAQHGRDKGHEELRRYGRATGDHKGLSLHRRRRAGPEAEAIRWVPESQVVIVYP